LRDDIDRFTQIGAEVVAVAPDSVDGVAKFVRDHPYPFRLLADRDHRVFDAYDVASRMVSLGQRPAVFVVDRDRNVQFDAVGTQQWQIPSNDVVLTELANCDTCRAPA
jgi:peroxiredoxin Q/BCP